MEQDWIQLKTEWEANEAVVMTSGTTRSVLSPLWRLLLLSDGSVTRHIGLMTDEKVLVHCIDSRILTDEEHAHIHPAAKVLPGPLLQRQVYLKIGGKAYVYATSWWTAATVNDFLKEKDMPIWTNLSASHTELYREVHRLYFGHSERLVQDFGQKGPFWGRHYTFHHGGKPLCVIYEVFNSALETFLGPTWLSETWTK